jgi:AcrR family transcriptional regulator
MRNDELDPRVRRTRALLHEALGKRMTEKDVENISIQDIADAATLNRATFYDHYTDKLSLLECTVELRFRELIAKRGIGFEACTGAIRGIVVGVCDYLQTLSGAVCGAGKQSEKYIESAIIAVVKHMILDGFKKHPPSDGSSVEIVSSTVAWAIYGAAKAWLASPDQSSVEEVADTIDRLVAPILLPIKPQAANSFRSGIDNNPPRS